MSIKDLAQANKNIAKQLIESKDGENQERETNNFRATEFSRKNAVRESSEGGIGGR